MVPSDRVWRELEVESWFNHLEDNRKRKKLKKNTPTLFSDLAVSAQQHVFHCGVKDETHVLQKALLVR